MTLDDALSDVVEVRCLLLLQIIYELDVKKTNLFNMH